MAENGSNMPIFNNRILQSESAVNDSFMQNSAKSKNSNKTVFIQKKQLKASAQRFILISNNKSDALKISGVERDGLYKSI